MPRHMRPDPRLNLLLTLLLLVVAQTATADSIVFRVEAPGAASVYLAGEFNNWSDSAQAMNDDDGDGIFELTIELAAGTYQYKFVVDGNWQEDPNATEFRDDGFGGKNSVLQVGAGDAAPQTVATPNAAPDGSRTVRFVAAGNGAQQVYLAGDFNSWSDSAQPMGDADGDGNFELVLELSAGKYAYKFVADGNWREDANATEFVDDGFGGKNSVVTVVAGEGIQDAGAAGKSTETDSDGAAETPSVGQATEGLRSVEFRYQPVISGVSEVSLAGSFNDWNVGATPMTDSDGDGTYSATLLLAPGSYQYKFVVDGTWITPEDADDYADDGFGGQNGVLRVDARFNSIEVEVGDGKFYLDGLDLQVNYSTVNEVSTGEVIFRTRAYLGDVEGVDLLVEQPGQDAVRMPMHVAQKDPVFANYQATVQLDDAGAGCRFTFVWKDDDAQRFALGAGGFTDEEPATTLWGLYSHDILPPFEIPMWAQQAVYYQIFPERFRNGDRSNDQDFREAYYDQRKTLPASGKTNGEYFHFEPDWNDVAGLQRSPYRTDGKPDYFSFYGGDIQGVMEKLDHLESIGVTVIYFNPLTAAGSNHRYDPCDYLKLDPHLGSKELFQEFTAKAKDMGIRVIVDMAYNHTGDCHFAFEDVLENWTDSAYFNWYEWKKRPPSYPLPAGAKAIDYYDCWWGFGLHPNLNYDLSRPNNQENGIVDIAQADPNWEMVNYLLGSVDYWMGELGCSGFRLDVPNEVPFWFWKLFRERCRKVQPSHILIGEIWGDAGSWIDPDVFDAVMNYKYFKDPVVKWIGQHQGNAATFDRELAPGRSRYPLQAVRAQMNLVDSHDTARFLNIAGNDARRLRLAATFSMTYVGAPHIYYGDELALAGDRDPDCRRTMPWDQVELPPRATNLEHYQKLGDLRREHQALSLGDFTSLKTEGEIYAYLRHHGDERILVALNNGSSAQAVVLPVGNVGIADGAAITTLLGGASEQPPKVSRGALRVTIPAVSGVIFSIAHRD
jgi:cyclomaltodextrinase / maltogenic alpha-amylase / neopullulanase